jgi:NIPSNAP
VYPRLLNKIDEQSARLEASRILIMITLHLCYTIDPNKLSDFKNYAEAEQRAISESGGHILGYFLPTDFAGPTNQAIGVIDFASLADYEIYRSKLAEHPIHKQNAEALEQSGALSSILRSLIQRVDPKEKTLS